MPPLSAEAVLATITEGIVVLSPDWKFLYVNRVAEHMLGTTASALLGLDIWELFPHAIGTDLEHTYRTAATTGEATDLEHFSAKRRRWFHVKVQPAVHGLTVCFRDITEQKHAAAAQKLAEGRFRLAAANRCITLYEQDRDLRYTWLYPEHPEHSHALGRTDGELRQDDSARELVALKQRVIATGQEARREIEVKLSSGTRHYDLFVSPRRNDAGEIVGVSGAALDITERKHFERALRQNEEQLRTMYEHAPVGLAETDLDGRLVSVNPCFCTLLGYTRDELVGKRFAEIAHPDEAAAYVGHYERLKAGDTSHRSSETRYLHRDGHAVWAELTLALVHDSQGRPKCGLGIVRDITEKKDAAAQQHLLYLLVAAVNRAGAVEEIYEAALDALCQSQNCHRGSILLHDENDVMRFTAWRGLSEAYRKAVEGHTPWRKDEPDLQPICIADVAACELTPELRLAVEREGIRALAFIPLTFENKLLGKFMIYYDEPHRFSTEELHIAETIARQVGFAIARQRAASALEALVAHRTASLQEAIQQMEEFSYTVSHDLRSPVRSMLTYIEAITEDHGANLEPEVREFIGRIQRSARRMDALVRDTLAYSRIARRELVLAPVSLDQIVDDVIAALDVTAQEAEFRIATPLGEAIGHELSLAQAISNLLHNALKFTRPGVPTNIAIRTARAGGRVRLSIEDNGIGIPPGLQPRLFRIFERLHPKSHYEGTGIGLAIVRKAVERMGGIVGAHSDGINGSTFWLDLPAAAETRAGGAVTS